VVLQVPCKLAREPLENFLGEADTYSSATEDEAVIAGRELHN